MISPLRIARVLFFDGFDFGEAAHVALFDGEVRAQERGDEFLGEGDADDARAEHEHVHIVMFDALMRGVGIVTEAGSDAGDFVGGDGGADAAAADENASFGFAGDDGFAQGFGEIGVVGRVGVEGADVENIVAELLQEFRNLLFEREAGVVGADCDAHIEHHNTLLDLVSYRRVMLMRNLAIVIVVIACAAGSASAASCDSMAALKLANVTVTSAKSIAAGAFIPPPGGGLAASYKDLPEFCRVEGVISPVADSHIEFEVWLPAAGWNNRYLGVGNGGFAGSINYAGLAAGVRTGYAVSSTDTGHKGGTTDAAWALGHFEKIIDYGNRAVHETSDKSKAIIRAFYGSNAKHNYFNGCSNGGRQALMEAQRYPADYDGIIAGAPANYLTHLVADFVGNMQALDASPATYMTAKQLQAVESAAVAACDLDDGVKDGVIGEPTKCKFDPAVLACKAGEIGQLPERGSDRGVEEGVRGGSEFEGRTDSSGVRGRGRIGIRRVGFVDHGAAAGQEPAARVRTGILRGHDVPGSGVGLQEIQFRWRYEEGG